MSGRTNNEEIGANLIHEIHNHANGMAAHDMDLYLDAVLSGLKADALDHRMKTARGDALGFPNFLDVLRHWPEFLHANQMKRRRVLFGHCDRQIECLERGSRAVISMQDNLEHRASLPLF